MGKKHNTTIKHVPKKHKETKLQETQEVDDSKDLAQTIKLAKKYLWNEKALIVLLLLVAIFFSTFFRMYPATLPITNQWAQDSYYNQVKNGIAQQVNSQYPNLPQAQKNIEIEKGLQDYIKANGASLGPQIKATSNYFKQKMQNDNNQTYLLAIDPYVWLSIAQNIEKYGMEGDEIVDGKSSFSLRNGREPKPEGATLHPYMIVLAHKIGSIFNKNYSLLKASFYLPVWIIGLAIIFAFFLGRKIAGNLAGFIAGMVIALNTALLGRTPAGFSDTDGYIILFPLLISWLLIESLTAKKTSNKLILAGVAGLAYSLFRFAWANAWHIGSILLGVLGVYFIYTLIIDWGKLSKIKTKKLFKNKNIQIAAIGIIFLVAIGLFSGLIGTMVNSPVGFGQQFTKSITPIFTQPLNALSVKSVASKDIWPNVLTTVAELNAGSWKQIFNSIGGKLFFVIGLIGILLTFTLKTEDKKFEIRYGALLSLWAFVLIVAGLMSSRFIALLAAPFAIAFGVAFGIIWRYASKLKSKDLMIVGRVALIIIVGILFIAPIGQAHKVALQEVPSMNDAWHTSLTTIKNETGDGVITSWWDFGHWFVNIARKRVTFDGGDQGKRIYWVGKTLMTNDLTVNKDILRMLNCGQNTGYKRLLKYTGNNYKAVQLINKIIYESKDNASAELKQAGLSDEEINSVLEKTHCSNKELLNQYVIVSQDMIGKAGVWAHFGGWNFTKAYIYNLAKNKPYDEAMEIMKKEIGMNEESASQLYFEANSLKSNREVDSWISPWPSYITTSAKACKDDNKTIVCTLKQGLGSQQGAQLILNKVIIPKENPKNVSANILTIQNGAIAGETKVTPSILTLGNENGWTTYKTNGTNFPYEVVVGKTESGEYKAIVAEKAVADSSFSKLFFFDGLGMTGYKKISDLTSFRGERIIVYKVDLNN